MARQTIHIWHGLNGEIVAVGKKIQKKGSTHRVTPISGENDAVIEIETDLSEEELKTVHRTHVVDVGRKILVSANKKKSK
jgi:hypothetical protein